MDKIDITCTATLRPELLRTTLESHIEHLFKDYRKFMRLIINIDCVGSEDYRDKVTQIMDVIDSCRFGAIKVNVAPDPHFGKAFVWCMENVESEFVYNLEEDWRLDHNVDINRMISLFYEDQSLAHLRLSMFRSESDTLKMWNKFAIWNGKYFEVKSEERGSVGWCGHPSLNRTSFMKAVLQAIDPYTNPEKQIKHKVHPRITRSIERCKFGVFHPQNSSPYIFDIGREWMIKNGYTKAGNKAFFTNWRKAE